MKKLLLPSLMILVLGISVVLSSCFLFDYTTPKDLTPTTTTPPVWTTDKDNFIQNSDFTNLNPGQLPDRKSNPAGAFQRWAGWNVTFNQFPNDGDTSSIFDASLDGSATPNDYGKDNHCIVAYTSVGNGSVLISQTNIHAVSKTGLYLMDFWIVCGTGIITTNVSVSPSVSNGAELGLYTGYGAATGASLDSGVISYTTVSDHSNLTIAQVNATGWDVAHWQHVQIPVYVVSNGNVDLNIFIQLGSCNPKSSDEFFRLDNVGFHSGANVVLPPTVTTIPITTTTTTISKVGYTIFAPTTTFTKANASYSSDISSTDNGDGVFSTTAGANSATITTAIGGGSGASLSFNGMNTFQIIMKGTLTGDPSSGLFYPGGFKAANDSGVPFEIAFNGGIDGTTYLFLGGVSNTQVVLSNLTFWKK